MISMADDLKDMSEHEVLLSDVNDQQHDFGNIHDDMRDDHHEEMINEDDDPLVKAALVEHENQQQKDKQDAIELGGGNIAADEDLPDLDKNAFRIPLKDTEIKCGISWSFIDDNKLIDLDLIVTALDLYSFEMDSVNKDHKKMFKKSIVYNKNKKNKKNKDDKSIDLKLDAIPANCQSLWFIINAYSGDSLKDVDKATFNIYSNNDEDSSSSEDEDDENVKDKDKENNKNILYSYDIDMGFDFGAILLGILYRSNTNNDEWLWTVVEEKNLYSQLIANNLSLIYNDKIISQRPNDKNTKYQFKNCGEQYIIDPSIDKLSIGLGWDLSSPFDDDKNMAIDQDQNDDDDVKMIEKKPDKKQKIGGFDIDIDVDGSIMVFSKIEKEENDKGVEEETCEQIDIVNNNNGFYKTYVQYINNDNYGQQQLIEPQKKKKKNNDNDQNNDSDEDDNELGVGVENLIDDVEIFDVYISKMNGDNNDIGSLCILLNIFNDNNLQNKNKTNNITNCYVRLIDANNNRKELCRFSLENINDDKKTCALVLGYISRLENGCWSLITNNIPLKNNSKLDYQDYAKHIVMGKYSQNNVANKDSCCVIL